MGSTFVQYGGHGFWVQDGLLELWLRFLALHIEDPLETTGATASIRNQWLLASRGYFTGCVPIDLDADMATEEGTRVVWDAVESLMQALAKSAPTLDKNALNLLGTGGVFVGDLDVWRLLELGSAFRDLLQGRMTTTASDPPLMPGCHERPL